MTPPPQWSRRASDPEWMDDPALPAGRYAAVLRDLVGRLPGGHVAAGLDALAASVPRRNRERLAGPDHDAIQATCADVARELGYEL